MLRKPVNHHSQPDSQTVIRERQTSIDVSTHADTHTHINTDPQLFRDVWVTHRLKGTPEMTPESCVRVCVFLACHCLCVFL